MAVFSLKLFDVIMLRNVPSNTYYPALLFVDVRNGMIHVSCFRILCCKISPKTRRTYTFIFYISFVEVDLLCKTFTSNAQVLNQNRNMFKFVDIYYHHIM